MHRAAIILTLSASFVLLAAWGVLHGGGAEDIEPLWAPLPGVASVPPPDPLDSKQICEHAARLKARFKPASVHTTILGYVVEPDGSMDDITVADTSGSKALDQSIIACVATLRFQPLKHGHAMMVQWK
jgi:TonB family protein